jgi:hypothetical protein
LHQHCEDDVTATDRPNTPPPARVSLAPERTRSTRPLLIAGAASISAGAVHAAAIGAHAEHPEAARTFAAVAFLQVAWGVWVIARPSRRLARARLLLNAGLVMGWFVAQQRGLGFIAGLDDKEPAQFADTLCAALAFASLVACSVVALRPRQGAARPGLAMITAVVLVAFALPGMVEAGNHVHSHSHGNVVVIGGQAQVTEQVAVPTKAFDPNKPIDLGGVPGVTEEEQARAENLLAETVVRLPQWADSKVAEAAGFHSIGDGGTGDEHLINWDFIDDGKILDPDHPEALVYNTRQGGRVLEAAMFMLPPGSTLNDVPDVGGVLTQWHIHDNLCFTNDPVSPRVAGLTNADGGCNAPLIKLEPVPMMHVWILPNPCGPFAALEGVGAGQLKPGETKACDSAHGSGL